MKLDVRTKVLLVCFANLTFLFRVSGWLEVLIVLVLGMLLFLSGHQKMALYQGLLFGLCFILDGLLVDHLDNPFLRTLMTLVTAVRFMLPSILAGSLLLTTSTAYDLVHGLRKWRLPESVLLTFAVMLRFIPAVKSDALIIQRSLKLRGIFLKKRDIFLQPFRYFEYMLVPLLMSLLRTVQDLTIASLTKGLALRGQATQAFSSRFRLLDWSVCLWMGIMIVWIIL